MAWWNPFQKSREQTASGSASPPRPASKDLEARLLRERTILLGTPINDEVAQRVVAQLLFLESENPTEGIRLYLNSPGGEVTAALAICDTLELVKPAVSTVCVGQCSGIAALLFALGERGQRVALTHSHFMLTPLTGGGRPGDASAMMRMRKVFSERLAHATGQTVAQIQLDCDAQRRLSASEAKHYGLVDQILDKTQL
ncbi:ClpP family protease [Hyalangium rubrum]|uniref:ATP-dependent Clp protease proteolytic subunit n=1 Tax=Hyalangium rubrum TaxID=3103134 RepID=A0ABU5HFA4_9BACT|nr:ATP-dependent Clp protease proteolytic subunit [Hyalangium sp. s54d21]MDY7232157.1 ATP-dependent Clp protease proteolytic subunit [Hyalangium sp. s54d21]